MWERCYAKAFTLKISDDGESWTQIYSGDAKGSGWQEIDFGQTYQAKYLGVFITEKLDSWGVAIWEIEVYDPTSNVYDTTALEANINAAKKAFSDHMVNAYDYNSDAWEAYKIAYNNAVIALAVCKNVNIDPNSAYPSQASVDTIANALNTAVANLCGGGTAKNNVLANGIMFCDPDNLTAHCSDINYLSLTDGKWLDDKNNYQPDKAEKSIVNIGLIAASDINKLVIHGEFTGYNMTIEYTTDSVKGVYGMDAYADLEWKSLCSTSDGSMKFSYSIENLISVYSFAFDTVENVTAVRIISHSGGWFKIREVEAYNDTGDDNYVTEILGDAISGTVKQDGQDVPAKFFCTNVSPAALEGKGSVVAKYTVKRGNKTVSETVYINNAYSVITLGDYKITSESFEGGHAGDYVVGLLFTNVAPGDEITVTFDGKSGIAVSGDGTPAAAPSIPEGNGTTYGISISDVDGDGVICVACVGDSITAADYPTLLAEDLKALSKIDGNTYEVKNFGKGGASVRHYLEQTDGNTDGVINPEGEYFWYDSWQYNDSLAYAADVYIIQMGTNDSYWWNPVALDDYFKQDYQTYLIDPYVATGAKVVLSTAPYSAAYDNANTMIRTMTLELAEENGLAVVDTNTFMYGKLDLFGNNGQDVHPNKTGYAVMAQNFYKYIFRGELLTAEITAVEGARITVTDVLLNREYVLTADENGKACFTFLAGSNYYLGVTATCEGYKDCTGNQLILNDADGSLVLNMIQG